MPDPMQPPLETTSSHLYVDGRGRQKRMRVRAVHREEIDIDLLAQGLIMAAHDIASQEAGMIDEDEDDLYTIAKKNQERKLKQQPIDDETNLTHT